MSIAWTTVEDALRDWVVGASGLSDEKVIWSDQGGPRPSSTHVVLNIMNVRRIGQDWVDTEDNPLTFTAKTFTADNTTDRLSSTAHALATGDGPIRLATTGGLPVGLAAGTDYWVIRIDADTLQLAATFLGAVETPTPVLFSTNGTPVHTIVSTANSLTAGQEITFKGRGMRECLMSVQCFAGTATGGTAPRSILDTVVAKSVLPTYRDALVTAGVGVAALGPVRSLGAAVNTTYFEPRAIFDFRFFLSSNVEEFGTIFDRTEITNLDTSQTFIVD